jgi:hypothetical protein
MTQTQQIKPHAALALLVCALAALLWTGCRAGAPAANAGDPTVAASPAPTETAAPTYTATPVPSPTVTPTETPRPTATPTPLPTATPTAIPQPRRLTAAGCCFGPFFLDGQVAFIDKPSSKTPAGFYAVPLTGGDARLIEPRMGNFLYRGEYFVFEENGRTVIERRRDKARLSFPALDKVENPGGISLSPDGQQIAWSVRDADGPYDQRMSQIWHATAAQSAGQKVMSLFGGGLSAWLSNERWLLTGRDAIADEDRTLFAYDLVAKKRQVLFKAGSFRNLAVSPDGKWVAFVVAFDPQPARNGLWLVRTDGTERMKTDFFGAFAWRDAGHLLYMPFQQAADSHEVWAFDVAQRISVQLTDAALTKFKIAQGDWTLAPDGAGIVYVSADDLSLRWLPLPADIPAIARAGKTRACACETP